MARLLALDWDHQQLHVVAAATGSRLRVQQAVVWPEPRTLQLAEAELVGKQLRERLTAAGITAGGVVACLGRDRVIVKEVRYPAASPADEPAIVRFQAAKELTDSAADVIIDYFPLGELAPNGERRAAALVIRKDVLAAYQALCKGAGLKLLGLTPRPLGTLACWRELVAKNVTPVPADSGSAYAILATGERWAEICVVRGNGILFSRALTVGASLAGDVRRNLAVYASQWPQYPVAGVLVAGGDDQAAVREQLQTTLAVPIHAFDPFATADRGTLPGAGLGGFTGAVGLLYAESSRAAPAINFVHPKQPVVQADPNKRKAVFYLAAAAVLLLGVGAFCWSQLDDRDRQIRNLMADKTDLDKQLTALQADVQRIKALDEWTKTQVNWLDELYDMTTRVPDTNALRLTDMTVKAGDPQGRQAKEKLGHISLKGIARGDGKALDHLRSQMETEASFRNVEPSNPTENRLTFERRRFPSQFSTGVSLEVRPPSKYVRELPKPSRPRASDAQPGEGDDAPEGGRP